MSLSPSAILKIILGVQIGLGVLLVAGDAAPAWQGLRLGPSAPRLDQPVAPGDQTRRYRPRDLGPGAPGAPFPPTGDMPARLVLSDVSIGGSDALRLVGRIAAGDGARVAEKLAERFEDADAPRRVYLHSPGGSVLDALDLGRFLRDEGIATALAEGDVCLSACPYLLAGGATREIDEAASVGVHQHYFGQSSVQPAFMAVEDIQRGQGQVMEYLVEMGIDPRIMQPALLTPPNEIYILLPDELRDYGMIEPVAE
ncbi:hypothetical protein ILP92_04795 [Maribius pontilimi]|uniref:Periplasmic protein-like protein n=1 Tax=Palleronia pontilimi TaxID=1964209 RepID=A0A934M926_9RHOB|nr:hypothetical protein [Palleronia pontilimi]MBJ3762062.1 hypothetical protein [Palleronia pontilimi]